MKNTLITIILTLAAVGLAFGLNPSADKHRKAIKEAVAERSQMNKLFGVGHLKAFASEYKSLGVASYTTVDDQLTSVGIFGLVYVVEE